MPKYHKIKWKESDYKELDRAIKNFNAKVTRLAKANPQNKSALPEKVQKRELKELINTRNDLRREINALKRFSKKGAETLVNVPESEYNIKITKWQKIEMNRRLVSINRRRAKRLEEMAQTQMTYGGESLGYTKAQIGMTSPELVGLQPLNAFTSSSYYTDIKEKWKTMIKESQADYWDKRDFLTRDTFIKTLEENYNPEDIKDVISAMKEMDISEWINIFREEGNTFEFGYPEGKTKGVIVSGQYENYVEKLKATWIRQ